MLESPVLYEAFLTNILKLNKVDHTKDLLKCAKGKHSEFFKVGAIEVGIIGNKSSTENITLQRLEDDCFGKVEVNFTHVKKNAINDVIITMKASDRLSPQCT